MAWESFTIRLACGCDGVGPWHEYEVGDGQVCASHGEQEIVRMGRIYEARGSRNAQFGEVSNAS